MPLPRRGEVAAYVAKQFDVQFGAEQKNIGRLKKAVQHLIRPMRLPNYSSNGSANYSNQTTTHHRQTWLKRG